MSLNVVTLPTPATADALWERYAALTRAAQDRPELLTDRQHVQAMILAHADFRDAFLRMTR